MATQYAGGPILTVPVSSGGAYTVAPTGVSLAGIASGFGATFTVNTSGVSPNIAVTSITVTAGGHAYPISGVTASLTGGTGTAAVLGVPTVSGGDVNNTHTSTGTKADLITWIQTQLTAAGWTVSSGGGTTNLLMQSAATPYGTQARFRFKDNGGVSVNLSLEDTTGTFVGTNSTNCTSLFPTNAKVFRIIANPYQFCITVDGEFTITREFAFGSVPFVPSFLVGVTNCAILTGNSFSDVSVSLPSSWRTQLSYWNNAPSLQMIFNSSLWTNLNNSLTNNTGQIALPQFVIPMSVSFGQIGTTLATTFSQPTRWAGLQVHMADPLMSWGLTGTTDEPQLRCQLWDATIVLDAFSGDVTTSFDSHSWRCITNQGIGVASASPRGSLFVVTP